MGNIMKSLNQITFYSYKPKFKINKPIRLIELFGGISCQAQALLNLGVNFTNYRYCDFDKYACQSHNEIIGTNDKPSDITKWKGEDLGICDADKYCYIMTYSFPCTDLSTAGKMAGMERGSGTRSGLLWEVERLLKECNELPQVHGKKNKASFDEWCQFLESLGYKNYWKDLNAKDYGVPQSRNRCFMVSLLGDYSYEFPEPIELKLKLQDLLEDEVDDRYYISDKIKDTYISRKYKEFIDKNGYIPDAFNPYNNAEIKEIVPTQSTQCGSVTSSSAVLLKQEMCNKLIQEGKVKENDVIRHSYSTSRINGEMKDIQQNNMSPTLDTRCDCLGVCKNYRIRKLTPKECLRLMGVRDEYSKRITCSNAQKYKQAGNGIVVDVLMAIFKQML